MGLFVKRLLDISVSAISLILFAPCILVIAILLKLESRGPIFFYSSRVGRNARIFKSWKFRTMFTRETLEQGLAARPERSGILFKLTSDPRVTKIGSFLRKYSLDEIPQFWNVLRGDMSLVGPRAQTELELDRYDLAHFPRLELLPGITGLWQVEGRSELSFDSYTALNAKYADEHSLWLDIKILVQTVGVVFKGTGY